MRPSCARLARALLACGLTATGIAQSTWYVDDGGVPPGSGTLDDPYTSIQFAIDAATTLDGDTLHVFPGTYPENLDLVGKALLVRAGAAGTVVVNGGGLGPVVRCTSGEGPDTVLEGLVLQNGRGASLPSGATGGGGLLVLAAAPTLRALEIEGCQADLGGGVYVRDGALDVAQTRFVANRADQEGGHAYLLDSEAVFEGCSFEGNGLPVDALFGGALFANRSAVRLVGGSVEGHLADLFGGGVHLRESALVAQGTTFRANQALCWNGGGLYLESGSARLEGCIFEDNRALDDRLGGGLDVKSGVLAATDCLFLGNLAAGGGGAWVEGGQARFTRCRFQQNLAEALIFAPGGSGGGLGVQPGAEVVVLDSLFLANEAAGGGDGDPGRGGGVYGPAELCHCTLAFNVAAVAGGAGHDARFTSSILWGDVPDELSGAATAECSDVMGGAPGAGNIDADPLFWNEPSLDLHLRPLSPCRGSGCGCGGDSLDMGALPFDWSYCATPCGPLGTAYCDANPNSTGQPALAAARGSADLDQNLLILEGRQLPPEQIGCFLMAATRVFIPGLGQGNLCLGSPILRLNGHGAQPVRSTGAGVLSFSPDLTALPRAFAVHPGETWHFQLWYRDANPGRVSNTTDGVAIRFE